MSSTRKPLPSATMSVSAEHLLQRASLLISNGRHTTITLAKALGVSSATAFRVVQELRRRGLPVESLRRGRRWVFVMNDTDRTERAWDDDPLLRGVGFIRGARPPRGDVDDELYGAR